MKKNCWTIEEVHYLKSNYSDKSYEELIKTLGRTKNAIKTKAYQQGLNKRKWTKEEINFLRKNYQDMSTEEIAEKLGKSNNAVKIKASRLKINKSNIYR